ncbi:hypothetical protein B0H10DRAFT_283248 [Mycena sp. CBHHK59/15]|nr:hypothetical protein B0H10DRAFT_283248 [Mycena sp. CBHHK59/15]
MGEVHGTFVLDPTLRVPQSMQARKPNKTHLRFSALMGEVSAEVYVVGAAPSGSDKTRMEVSSTLGSVSLKLHAVEPRAPLMITVSARMGEVVLRLPRSFRGPLRLSTTMGTLSCPRPCVRLPRRSEMGACLLERGRKKSSQERGLGTRRSWIREWEAYLSGTKTRGSYRLPALSRFWFSSPWTGSLFCYISNFVLLSDCMTVWYCGDTGESKGTNINTL